MQNGAVHDDRALADPDAVRAGVQVDALVDVCAVIERDVVCVPQSHAALDGGQTVHSEYQAIGHCTYRHAERGWDPARAADHDLFEQVTPGAVGLSSQVECNVGTGRGLPRNLPGFNERRRQSQMVW
jgi:hypothetical protein